MSCVCVCVCVQSTVYNCTDGVKHHNRGGFVERPSRHISLHVTFPRLTLPLTDFLDGRLWPVKN